ncbi:MAG: sugar phosphate isomerase/epimerase [Planctomycetes bacterium]|nr:sugar phosphate isomerase/epimerase [Planctomycetota bacterium]
MYVACSTLCFARQPLERALRIIGELEFSKLDVAIHENGPHLKPSEVVADVGLAAQRIRIGPSLTPAAFSIEIEAASDEDYIHQLRAICRLARVSTVSVLTIPAAKTGSSVDTEVQRLSRLANLVDAEGMVLTVVTGIGTLTERPATALELCKRVRSLGLTLDPSAYINGPHQGGSIDELIPYVRHVHLRDTGRGPGKFQVRVGQGEIEYGRIITQLERSRYDRLLSVAIHDVAEAPFAMETEVRKLKFLLESLV